jgi:hypothetical protein
MTTYEAPTLFPAWQTTTGKFETIDDKFRAFHDANPWLADELEKLADVEYRHGDGRIGIKYLIEVLRWNYRRATTGQPFRIDNDFTSRYARLLVDRRPEFANLFETRTLRRE